MAWGEPPQDGWSYQEGLPEGPLLTQKGAAVGTGSTGGPQVGARGSQGTTVIVPGLAELRSSALVSRGGIQMCK